MKDHNLLPTEIILNHSQKILGKLKLDWQPQPGHYVDLEGKIYTVLERRHRYQWKAGKYHLHKIAIYVQASNFPEERSLCNGEWIIGDANCFYNAHSPLIRCAINPSGPCDGCKEYTPLNA